MSSAANHRKRSHRSERTKASAYAASARRSYYSSAATAKRQAGFFRRVMDALTGRKNPPANRKPKAEEG